MRSFKNAKLVKQAILQTCLHGSMGELAKTNGCIRQ